MVLRRATSTLNSIGVNVAVQEQGTATYTVTVDITAFLQISTAQRVHCVINSMVGYESIQTIRHGADQVQLTCRTTHFVSFPYSSDVQYLEIYYRDKFFTVSRRNISSARHFFGCCSVAIYLFNMSTKQKRAVIIAENNWGVVQHINGRENIFVQ